MPHTNYVYGAPEGIEALVRHVSGGHMGTLKLCPFLLTPGSMIATSCFC